MLNHAQIDFCSTLITFLPIGLDESATGYSLEENVALVTYGNENQVLQHLTKDYSLVQNKLSKHLFIWPGFLYTCKI